MGHSRLLIRLPDYVVQEQIREAILQAMAEKPNPYLQAVEMYQTPEKPPYRFCTWALSTRNRNRRKNTSLYGRTRVGKSRACTTRFTFPLSGKPCRTNCGRS